MWDHTKEIVNRACYFKGEMYFTSFTLFQLNNEGGKSNDNDTVEPLYTEVLGTMKITLLYQVSHYIRGKKNKEI